MTSPPGFSDRGSQRLDEPHAVPRLPGHIDVGGVAAVAALRDPHLLLGHPR